MTQSIVRSGPTTASIFEESWVWKGSEAAAGDDEQDRKVYDEAVLIAIESCLHRLRMNLMHLNATPVNTPVPLCPAFLQHENLQLST